MLKLDDLLNLVSIYNPDEVEIIRKAYYYADRLHNMRTLEFKKEFKQKKMLWKQWEYLYPLLTI